MDHKLKRLINTLKKPGRTAYMHDKKALIVMEKRETKAKYVSTNLVQIMIPKDIAAKVTEAFELGLITIDRWRQVELTEKAYNS